MTWKPSIRRVSTAVCYLIVCSMVASCVCATCFERKTSVSFPPRSVFMITAQRQLFVSYRINIRVCVCVCSRQIVLPVRQELKFPITLN
jgi:hypothetical protein